MSVVSCVPSLHAVTIFSDQSVINRVYTSRFGNRMEPQPRWYWKKYHVPGTVPSRKPCTMQWKSAIILKGPQNVYVKFQLKIPDRSIIISFWKCLFWVEAEAGCFCACLFKCKWATVPHSLFQNSTVPLQLVSQISAKKNICLVLIIISMALK